MTVEINSLNAFNLNTQDRDALCKLVCHWEQMEYGEGRHRTPAMLLRCINKNDTGFICAFEGESLLGYADLWQLKTAFYHLLAKGELLEEELLDAYVLAPTDKDSALWYVGSIITDPAMREKQVVKSAQVFHRIFELMYERLLHVPCPGRVMGVGSTAFGGKLLRKHGFKEIKPSSRARDFRPRFERLLNDFEMEPATVVAET